MYARLRSGSPQEAEAELAYLSGLPTDTTDIGGGIWWNDNANGGNGAWVWVSDWGTVGYWASLRAAVPLATDDGLNFLRISHPAPFTNFNYWEVGNEVYGSWEVDHHGTAGPSQQPNTGVQHDPVTHAVFAAALAKFIASDPLLPQLHTEILIGIVCQDPTTTGYNGWLPNVLTAGLNQVPPFIPDFIADHTYEQGSGSENDSFLLNSTVSYPTPAATPPTAWGNLHDWAIRYQDYQYTIQSVLGHGANIPLIASEWGSYSFPTSKQSVSVVDGLFTADSMGSLLESGYAGAILYDLRNGWQTNGNLSSSLYGWREGGDAGIIGRTRNNNPPSTGPYVPYPGYFAMQLASKFIQNGGQVVSAASNISGLSVYAVKEANGHLGLLVINENPPPAASLTDTFALTGFQPSGAAQVWQYGVTQDTAQSLTTDGITGIQLANSSTTLTLTGANFSYSFPPYSMTVLDLTPGTGSLDGDPVACGRSDGRRTVAGG